MRIVGALWVAIGLCGPALVGAQESIDNPVLRFAEVLPALDAEAEKAGIPLAGITIPDAPRERRLGDALTFLVEEEKGGKRLQWYVYLVANPLSEGDETLPPPPDAKLYTSTGNEISIGGEWVAVAIHVYGPVQATRREPEGSARKAKDIWSGTLVNKTFLGLGLDRACSTILRLRSLDGARRGGFSARGQPFAAEEIAAGKALTDEIGLTSADEAAITGTIPALLEFFRLASRSPGIDDIVMDVIDLPVWSLVLGMGRGPQVGFALHGELTEAIEPAQLGIPPLPGLDLYSLTTVLQLNGKSSLVCRLAVAEPRGPLHCSAGIVGLVAESPDGKGARMSMRLVATRDGAP